MWFMWLWNWIFNLVKIKNENSAKSFSAKHNFSVLVELPFILTVDNLVAELYYKGKIGTDLKDSVWKKYTYKYS